MPIAVGVCAIQGDFERHLDALARLGDAQVSGSEVRTVDDLAKVDRLILPGGESTTVGLLMDRFGLGQAIRERVADGMPIWGTCMGMILLAKAIEDRPNQWTLGVLDVAIQRNAFGAQVHSFEADVHVSMLNEPVLGVFIRAPIVTKLGSGVESIAEFDGKIVAVKQGHILGTSFHPELTSDLRMHAWFCRS